MLKNRNGRVGAGFEHTAGSEEEIHQRSRISKLTQLHMLDDRPAEDHFNPGYLGHPASCLRGDTLQSYLSITVLAIRALLDTMIVPIISGWKDPGICSSHHGAITIT